MSAAGRRHAVPPPEQSRNGLNVCRPKICPPTGKLQDVGGIIRGRILRCIRHTQSLLRSNFAVGLEKQPSDTANNTPIPPFNYGTLFTQPKKEARPPVFNRRPCFLFCGLLTLIRFLLPRFVGLFRAFDDAAHYPYLFSRPNLVFNKDVPDGVLFLKKPFKI